MLYKRHGLREIDVWSALMPGAAFKDKGCGDGDFAGADDRQVAARTTIQHA